MVIWVSNYIVPVLDKHTKKFIRLDSVVSNITKRKKVEEKLHFMAYHDPLTELPNRRKFTEELNKLLLEAANKNKILALDLN